MKTLAFIFLLYGSAELLGYSGPISVLVFGVVLANSKQIPLNIVKRFGADHPQVALALNNLAVLYYIQARYDEAEPLYRRALEGRQAKLGADHPHTLSTLNNLAIFLKQHQGLKNLFMKFWNGYSIYRS